MSLRRCLFVLLFGVSAWAQAASVARTADFYQGAAAVDSRSQQEREAAIKAALSEVLVRMTGDVSVSLSDKASVMLAGASRFVRSYRYVEREKPVAVATQAPDATPPPPDKQRYLLVDFDPDALIRAVKNSGLPLWDDQRPVTAVWMLAPGEQGARTLWGREQIEQRLPALREAAQLRGIPVRFPLMDMQDRSAISSMDVVGEDAVRLGAASARYEARHQLLVVLGQSTPNLWEAQWSSLRDEEGPLRWNSVGEDANQAMANGFTQYANELARQYALELAPGWVQSSRVRVVGVPDIGSYARVMAFLQRLNLVESVQPAEVLARDVVFLVEFEGTLEDLERSIELGDLLVPAPETMPVATPMPTAPPAQGMQGLPGTPSPPPTDAAQANATQTVEPSGLSFFAVHRRPELRYRLKP